MLCGRTGPNGPGRITMMMQGGWPRHLSSDQAQIGMF